MKRTTIEFMIGWLDALRRDDVDALKATLAPDVVWQGLRDEWACHGADAVIDTFAGEREDKQEIGAIELIGARSTPARSPTSTTTRTATPHLPPPA